MNKDFDIQSQPIGTEATRTWIREACAATEITPTELARRAGLAPSTINRFLKEGGGVGSLNGNTVGALWKVVQAALREGGLPTQTETDVGQHKREAAIAIWEQAKSNLRALVTLHGRPARLEKQIESFIEIYEIDFGDDRTK